MEEERQLNEFMNRQLRLLERNTDGHTTLVQHRIVLLKDANPFYVRPYAMSPEPRAALIEHVRQLLSKGFIERQESRYNSSPVMVRKKDNSWRFCVDYRKLNKMTECGRYPLPNLQRILYALHGARYISTLDLKDAFHQIEVEPESRKYTAFSVEGFGQFVWKRMPFGLSGAPGTYQRLTDELRDLVCKELQKEKRYLIEQIHAYLDDWILVSETFEEHLLLLKAVLEVFRKAGLKVNREKSHFAKTEVEFLGFLINEEGMRPLPNKIKPIEEIGRAHV